MLSNADLSFAHIIIFSEKGLGIGKKTWKERAALLIIPVN